MKNFNKLKEIWEEFANIPINGKDQTIFNFYQWPAGTNKEDIWHWFDYNCTNNLHDDLMFPRI